jgi:hypothetical protein
MKLRLILCACLVGATLLLSACDGEFVPDADGIVYHWSLQGTTAGPRVIDDRLPTLPAGENYQELIE